MGSSAFLVAIIVIAIFGVDFKKGFLLFQLLLWTGLVTEILKILVAFPRPDFVDNRVLNLEFGIKNTSPFSGNEPKGIFALPDKQILKAFRLQEAFTLSPFGFPSGHVALTTALWGGSSHCFQEQDNQNIDSFRDSSHGFFKGIPGKTFHRRCTGRGYFRVNFPGPFCTFSQKLSER